MKRGLDGRKRNTARREKKGGVRMHPDGTVRMLGRAERIRDPRPKTCVPRTPSHLLSPNAEKRRARRCVCPRCASPEPPLRVPLAPTSPNPPPSPSIHLGHSHGVAALGDSQEPRKTGEAASAFHRSPRNVSVNLESVQNDPNPISISDGRIPRSTAWYRSHVKCRASHLHLVYFVLC